ncbi:hypothetical protein HZA44_03440 [Candidatus Peregrinibacteria bacterium]|nr:hypothetical protein [Candidatus Peregrinibacteria bacterium]
MKTLTLIVALFTLLVSQVAQAACPSQFASLPLPDRCNKAKETQKKFKTLSDGDVAACCEEPKATAPATPPPSGEKVSRPQPTSPPPNKGSCVSSDDFAALKARVDSHIPDGNGLVTQEQLQSWFWKLLYVLIGILVSALVMAGVGAWLYRLNKGVKQEVERLENDQLALTKVLVDKKLLTINDIPGEPPKT